MESMIGYCGLACDTCPIHLATLEKDQSRQAEMRVNIAEELSRIYGTTPKPEIIGDCDGCRAISGKIFAPSKGCEIRNCAGERGFENCACCDDFECEKLTKHYVYDPDSRKRLYEIKASDWHNNCH